MEKKKGQETSTNTQETAQSATAEPSNSVRLFCDLCTVLQVKKKQTKWLCFCSSDVVRSHLGSNILFSNSPPSAGWSQGA